MPSLATEFPYGPKDLALLLDMGEHGARKILRAKKPTVAGVRIECLKIKGQWFIHRESFLKVQRVILRRQT